MTYNSHLVSLLQNWLPTHDESLLLIRVNGLEIVFGGHDHLRSPGKEKKGLLGICSRQTPAMQGWSMTLQIVPSRKAQSKEREREYEEE